MAKSAGGGGRRGRGRVAVGPTPGSAADVLRQRAAFRASPDAPPVRQLGGFELVFQPRNIQAIPNRATIREVQRIKRANTQAKIIQIGF